jgi:beta-phosphoglucomutase-like phosphatase (HAD superfamily)
VIFDVDGLIVDSEEIYCRTFNSVLETHGVSLTREDYTVCVGHPVEENGEYAVKQYGLNTTSEALCKAWMDRFDEAISDPEQVILMPGVLDLIARVRKKPYKLGIASSTLRPRMTRTLTSGLLSRLDGVSSLDEIFGAILSGSDVSRLKPDPEIYLKAAAALAVDPARCAVLEDSEAGVRAGKAAGMTVIGVPNFFTSHQDHSTADFLVGSLAEVVEKGLL